MNSKFNQIATTTNNNNDNDTPTHVHYHNPSTAQPMIVKFVICIISIPFLWFGGIFLLNTAGLKNSDKLLAQVIVFSLIFLLLVWLMGKWLGGIIDRYLSYKEVLAKEQTHQLQAQQLLAHASTTRTRQQGDNARLYNMVYLVMTEAYKIQLQYGYLPGWERPWSRRGVKKLPPINGQLATSTDAAQIKAILESQEIITGYPEQINIKRYPDLASIEAIFSHPIIIR